MHADSVRSDDVQPIKIRLRQVFSGSGEVSQVESVYCPARERSTSLEVCSACAHTYGLYQGPDAGVLCDHHDAREPTLRHGRAGEPDLTRVADVMTTHVLCVRADVSLVAVHLRRHPELTGRETRSG